MVVILIRRTRDDVYYKYISSGKPVVPHETWSSSKFFAVAAAAATIRRSCKMGMDASVKGRTGVIPLGDLATIIASYDSTKGYSSNGLAKYFGTMAGDALSELVKDKLGLTNDVIGGSYGLPVPGDLGTKFSLDGKDWCSLKTSLSKGGSNSLSVLTAAEIMRRIVMHREISKSNRIPGFWWKDAKQILYGSADSTLFKGLEWGGMSSDISTLIQSRLIMDDIQSRSNGKWRIFDKAGWGFSSAKRGDVRQNGYACFPVLDDNGSPKPNAGVEFIIATRGTVNGATDAALNKARGLVQAAVGDVVEAIANGQIS
jgi:hypothetical protein